MDGKRWSGNGTLKDKLAEMSYARASGYIPISTGDVVRMSGISFGASTVQFNTNAYIQSFGSNLTIANEVYAGQLSLGTTSFNILSNIQYDNNGNVTQFTYAGGSGYLTICSNSASADGGIQNDAVLTINEMID